MRRAGDGHTGSDGRDAMADVLALVHCRLRADGQGARAVLANCDPVATATEAAWLVALLLRAQHGAGTKQFLAQLRPVLTGDG